MMSMTIHRSDPGTNGYKEQTYFPLVLEITDLESLHRATRYDHSPSRCEGGRADVNFAWGNCIYWDIDNAHSENPEDWITLEIVKETFDGIAMGITPSRNHMKQKEKEGYPPDHPGFGPRPRYHGVCPVAEMKGEEGAQTLRDRILKLHQRFPDMHFDEKIKDPSRFFFGHGREEITEDFHYQEGKSITSLLSGPPKTSTTTSGLTDLEKLKEAIKTMDIEEIEDSPDLFKVSGARHYAMLRLTALLAIEKVKLAEIIERAMAFNDALGEFKKDNYEKEIRRMAEGAKAKVQSGKLGGMRPAIRNFRFEKDEDGKLRQLAEHETTKAMWKTFPQFYTLAFDKSQVLHARLHPMIPLNSPSDLSVALEDINYRFLMRTTRPQDGLNESKIFKRYVRKSEQVERLTILPEVDPQYGTMNVDTIPYPEARDNGVFREYLSCMTFENPTDEHRFAALAMSLFLGGYWDGKVPMGVTVATAQNSGKSTVLRYLCKIVTRRKHIRQHGTARKEKDDKAQFGNTKNSAGIFVLYDNIANMTPEEELGIVTVIDEPTREAWDMSISRQQVVNSYKYFGSLNDSEGFGRDLQERVLPIRMMDPDKVSEKRRREIDKKMRDWLTTRGDELRANIRFFAEKMAGEQSGGKVHAPQKFSEWGVKVSPAMEALYPDVEAFNFADKDARHKLDPEVQRVTDLLLSLVEQELSMHEGTRVMLITRKGGKDMRLRGFPKEFSDIINANADKFDSKISPKGVGMLFSQVAPNMETGNLHYSDERGGRRLWMYDLSKNEIDELQRAKTISDDLFREGK